MRPSVLSVSAPPITLMVITSVLSSYLQTYLLVFQLAPYGLAIVSSFYCSQLLLEAAIVPGLIVPLFLLFPV